MTRDFLCVLNASFSITSEPSAQAYLQPRSRSGPALFSEGASRRAQKLLCLRYFSRFGFCNFQSSQTNGSSALAAAISIWPPPSLEGGLGRELARDEVNAFVIFYSFLNCI